MVYLMSINGPIWWFLKKHVYEVPPPPPPRKRTKPIQVICVGLPRSGTESLQHALIQLGYDYTYHGWDIILDQPIYAQEWAQLARRKFRPDSAEDGECEITAEDFDKIIGHCVAVTDAAASVFASEMIRAYPDAKVTLNIRRDLDKSHQSAVKNLVGINRNWLLYLMTWFCKESWWPWHAYERLLWAGLFRCIDGDIDSGIRKTGKWVYREHCDMIRGLVPKEKLLDWSIEDGWGPLCQFLGKEIPDVKFPRTNDAAAFKGREQDCFKRWFATALKNFLIILTMVVLISATLWMLL